MHKYLFRSGLAQNLSDAEVVWHAHTLTWVFELMVCLPGLVKTIFFVLVVLT